MPVEIKSLGPFEMQTHRGYDLADLQLLQEYSRQDALPEPGAIVDFMGVKTRLELLWPGTEKYDNTVLGLPIPGDFHAQTIEYVGLVKSVATADGHYHVMELGAGFGPWMVAGGVVARDAGITDIRMLGVEADPGRFEMMKTHLAANGFDHTNHTLYQAAVGAVQGHGRWPKIPVPAHASGGRPIRQDDDSIKGDVNYAESTYQNGIDVQIMAFAGLLEHEACWNLVHIDIQGWEYEICRAAIELLTERAKYVIIGTHSRKIEGDLIELFWQAGWILENEKPCHFNYDVACKSLERMTYTDGAQVWKNPELAGWITPAVAGLP